MAERLREVETFPSRSQIIGLRRWAITDDGPRITYRNDVVGPILSELRDLLHHGFRRQVGTGHEFAFEFLRTGHDLDVRPADIDRQNGARPTA
jgi:hypothetical protein